MKIKFRDDRQIEIELNKNTNTFNLVVLGDLHIGDKQCDLPLIKHTIQTIKDTPNCYVILNGDLMNNALKTSKSDSYQEQMSMAEQQDLLVELLYPIKDRILVITGGNHEYRTELLAGINPTKYIAKCLDCLDRYFVNSYIVTLKYGTPRHIPNRWCYYTIFGIHGGYGGGRKIGATANAVEDMKNIVPNADLYVHSHTHKNVFFSDSVFVLNKATHRLNEHIRHYYNANAFLKYGGYAEMKGYAPSDRSCNMLKITNDYLGRTKTDLFKI